MEHVNKDGKVLIVSKLFRAYRLYNLIVNLEEDGLKGVSKLFRAYRLYNN